MRRGAEPQIGATRPVGGIMTGAVAIARRVRDFVEVIAVSRKPYVSKEGFFRVSLVVGGGRRTAGDPAGERGWLLGVEPVGRELRRESVEGECQLPGSVAREPG